MSSVNIFLDDFAASLCLSCKKIYSNFQQMMSPLEEIESIIE